jgi:hypothetical protein
MNDIFKMAEQAYHALSIAESELKRLYKENAELKNSLTRAVEQKREWVGLTDEEMRTLKQKSVDDGMIRIVTDFEYIRSIEAKLKEKNT